MQTDLAPVVLFVYNRPWHTRQTLDALSRNELADKSMLFIYSDGAPANATIKLRQSIEEVRKIIRENKWCSSVEIIERVSNLGLAESVISGITEITKRFGKVIVLEDDLITSIGFLKYMNAALTLYRNENKVMHVSGYMLPVKSKLPETFFYNATSCWGWGTWLRAWENFNNNANQLMNELQTSDRMNEYTLDFTNGFDQILQDSIHMKNDSWSAKWHTTVFLLNGFSLHPNKSLVRNIGHDQFGKHCKNGWWSEIYTKQKISDLVSVEPTELIESKIARKAIKEFYISLSRPPIWLKVKEKLKQLF